MDLDAIYMAGFFDGEGYIGILKRHRGNHCEYFIQISIGQKDGAVMDWVKTNFGGNLYVVKRDQSYYWTIAGRKAEQFLRRIEPYLKYKRPQALVALSFYDGEFNNGKKVLKQELKRREGIYLKLKAGKKIFSSSSYCI